MYVFNTVDIGYIKAWDLIIVFSVAGVLLLMCVLLIAVTCIALCLRRRTRNKRIDRYLNMFNDTDGMEESTEYMMHASEMEVENEERVTVTNRTYKTPMALAWARGFTNHREQSTTKFSNEC